MVSTDMLEDLMQAQATIYLKGTKIARRELMSYGVAVSNVSNRVMGQCASLAILATWLQERIDLLQPRAPEIPSSVTMTAAANDPVPSVTTTAANDTVPSTTTAAVPSTTTSANANDAIPSEAKELPRIILEVLGMHECRCEVCDPGHLAKVEEIARLSAKSEFRETVKKKKEEKVRGKTRTKFKKRVATELKKYEAKCIKDFQHQIRSELFRESQEQ